VPLQHGLPTNELDTAGPCPFEEGATWCEVGRCTLNYMLTHSLKATGWFQTLTLAHQSWFQSVPFKFNLRRYSEGYVGFRWGDWKQRSTPH
jgi:hypothetical protein